MLQAKDTFFYWEDIPYNTLWLPGNQGYVYWCNIEKQSTK